MICWKWKASFPELSILCRCQVWQMFATKSSLSRNSAFSNQEIMVSKSKSKRRGDVSESESERNVTCWDPTHKTEFFSVKLLSKSRPWSISLERLQCRWVDSKICMILPSSARFLFSFSSIKFWQRFCCSQFFFCEKQWKCGRDFNISTNWNKFPLAIIHQHSEW